MVFYLFIYAMDTNKEDLSDAQKKAVIDREITYIYDQLVVNSNKICSYMSANWAPDLLVTIVEYFLKMDLDKQYKIVMTPSKGAGTLERYLTRAMALSVKSSTSPFFIRHRKHLLKNREIFMDYDYSDYIGFDEIDKEDIWEHNLDNIREVVNNLHFYNKYLIDEHYFKGQRLEDMSKTTQISTYRLSKDIKIALEELKSKLK